MAKTYRSKRVMAHMRSEQSAFVQAKNNQYMGRLVNLSVSGALLAILESEMTEEIGTECDVFFGGAGRMVEVQAELVRVNGRFAAVKFPQLSVQDMEQIEAKLYRLDSEAERLDQPLMVH